MTRDTRGKPGARAAEHRAFIDRARADAEERRALVLAHPDLAAMLTEPPLDYPRPEAWNGYVPPDLWREQRNGCARRECLAGLVEEAYRRGPGPPGNGGGTAPAGRAGAGV